MGCNSSLAAGCALPSEQMFHAKYQLGTKLGEGNFGQVRLATSTAEGTTSAVKVLHHVKTAGGYSLKEAQDIFQGESSLWQQVNNHKNVVQFFEAFGAKDTHYIVMEACKCSVLDGLKNQRLLMEDLSRVFREMALGLAHCHEKNVVHRDVKPDNFLLGGVSGQEIKLTDFGLATVLSPKKKLHGVAGTAPYMSPELLGLNGYDEKTDVWSLGVTAYVMLFGVFPYMPKERSGDAMKAMVRKGSPAPSFKPVVPGLELPMDAIEFAKTLLNRNPARISMHEVPKLRFVVPDACPSASASKEVTSALKMAKALTQEFKQQVDPTVQRSLDDLLQRLQSQQKTGSSTFDNSDAAPSWFSETPQHTESLEVSSDTIQSVATVVRRKSRHSTHDGVSLSSLSFKDIKDDSDDDTNASTRPPTPEEALPPLPQVVGVGNLRSAHGI